MTATSTQAPPPIVHPSPRNEKLKSTNFLDGETVTMHFPVSVKLQLDDGAGTVQFYPGTQEVPRHLANHWWLKSNGVRAYGKGVQTKAPGSEDPVQPLARVTERELAYMQSQGWRVFTVPDAQLQYENMEPIARPEFLKAAQRWDAERMAKQDRQEFDLLGPEHLEFLQAKGYKYGDLGAAQRFFDELPTDLARRSFLAQVGAWQRTQEGNAVELDGLTKDQLVLHAFNCHDLELDKSTTKSKLIEAIEKARG